MTEMIESVADGVWVGIPGPGEGAMAAVVDGGEMLVLDTTSYNIWAERFVGHVADAESCRGPSLLYISHRHFDHFAGADALDVPVIGHWLTRAVMARYTQEWMNRNIEEWTRLEMLMPELLHSPKVVLPQILFDTHLEIAIGSSVVQFMHVGGHCTDQTVAYLPKQRVLFASDNIIHEKPVYTGDGDLFAWIEALRKLQKLPIDVVIPGHGSVGGAELVEAKIAYLEDLLDAKLRGEG